MNRVLSVIVLGIISGVSCTVGMRLGEKILDKVEVQKTKDAKIIKIKA